jgi:hypothetical protein
MRRLPCAHSIITVLSILISVTCAQPPPPSAVNYGIVVDCGSIGTDAWVFNWTNTTPDKLPVIQSSTSPRGKPIGDQNGVSENITDILTDAVEYGKEIVPEKMRSFTPIYIFGTGVFRLMSPDNATELVNRMKDFLKTPALNPFLYTNRSARIITGEEEATMNYLTVHLALLYNSSTAAGSYGLLSLGYASTHIVFTPPDPNSLLGAKQTVSVLGVPHSFYTASYEHYGQDYIEVAVRNKLVQDQANQTIIQNPCYLKGETRTIGGRIFNGTGVPSECAAKFQEFMYKISNTSMLMFPRPFGIGYTYQPPIPTDLDFLVLDTFQKSLNTLRQPATGRISLDQIYRNVSTLCSKHLGVVTATLNQSEFIQKYISISCQTLIYLNTLLTVGYGFPSDTNRLIAAQDINDIPTDYPLGGLIYELLLVPPPPQQPPSPTPPLQSPPGPTCGGGKQESMIIVLFMNLFIAWVITMSRTFSGRSQNGP